MANTTTKNWPEHDGPATDKRFLDDEAKLILEEKLKGEEAIFCEACGKPLQWGISTSFNLPPITPDTVKLGHSLVISPCQTCISTVPNWEAVVQIGKKVPRKEWKTLPTDLAERIDHYLYSI